MLRPARSRHRRNSVNRHIRTAAAVVGLLLLLLLLDGIYVAFSLRSSLVAAEGHLREAKENFDADDTARVEDSLSGALIETGKARSAVRHPAFSVARRLPLIGGDAASIDSLVAAADLSARAGLSALQAVEAAGGDGETSLAAAVYRGGRVNMRAIDRADPKVREAARLLAAAENEITSAPGGRIDRIETALETAEDEISGAADAATKGVALLDSLPGLLGRGGVKEYFLAFQSPSEIRGAGGFAGVYGILTAENGRLSMGEVKHIAELGTMKPPVKAPGWYQDLYRDAGALTDPRQANYSPHFPVVSEVWLEMYERQTDQRLDGVVAMDPVALAEFTKGTGPISAPGLERQVGPDNAIETLLHDSYVQFDDPDDQQAYLAALVDAFWERLDSGEVDAQPFASGLAAAVSTGHFKFYATDEDDQDALVRLGASGDYTAYGDNVQLIYANNAAVNKIDFFMHRTIDTEINLDDDGSALVTTRITLENRAPADAPRSLLFGPGIEGDEAGLNAMVLYVLLPQDSQLRRFSIDGERSPALQGREGDHPVAYDIVKVPSGETGTVEVVYRMARAWTPQEERFDFVLYPQAAVPADRYQVNITAPEGVDLRPHRGSPGAGTSSGVLEEPVELSFGR